MLPTGVLTTAVPPTTLHLGPSVAQTSPADRAGPPIAEERGAASGQPVPQPPGGGQIDRTAAYLSEPGLAAPDGPATADEGTPGGQHRQQLTEQAGIVEP